MNLRVRNSMSLQRIIGIDATNLRQGGGLLQIIELLSAAEPKKHKFDTIIIWAGSVTLEKLPNRSWLIKKIHQP